MLSYQKNYQRIELEDLSYSRIEKIITGLGVPFSFDVVAICAQDHGRPPKGVGYLDFRHQMFADKLDKTPFPHTLLFESSEIPDYLSRLKAIATSAQKLPTKEIFVMDSGMAAILGASMDIQCQGLQSTVVLDIASSHTVGAVLTKGEIGGFFEYHTHDITLNRLNRLLQDLPDGNLDHRQIIEEGGHGAYIRKSPGFTSIEKILATGPKRQLVAKSHLPIIWGAPWGDNMMTGTVGLLEAVRRRKGMPPLGYI